MKVIDLLNKIAKGEEAPEKIKYKDDMFTYYEYADEIRKYYIYEKHNIYWFDREYFDLDTEVEIIEEDKEIEHYDVFDNFTGFGFGGTDKELLSDLQNNFEHINEELDYLIKSVNELKKGK